MGFINKMGESFSSIEEKISVLTAVVRRKTGQYQAIANDFVREVKGVAVKVAVSIGDGSYCTEGENGEHMINVSVPDEWVGWYSIPYIRFNLITMLLMHECGHARFTDCWFEKSIEDSKKLVDKMAADNGKALPPGFVFQICHHITNSLEDGRIEKIDALRFKGFDLVRRTHRGKLWSSGAYESIENNEKTELDRLYVVLNSILSLATTWRLIQGSNRIGLGLYQKGTTAFFRDNPDCLDMLKLCKPYIVEAINADTCQGIYHPTVEIIKIIYPLIESVAAIPEEEAHMIEKFVKLLSALARDFGNQGVMQTDDEKAESQKAMIDVSGGGQSPASNFVDDSDSENAENSFERETKWNMDNGELEASKKGNGGSNIVRDQQAIDNATADIQAGVAKEENFCFVEKKQNLFGQTYPISPEKLIEAKSLERFIKNTIRNRSTYNRMNMKRGKLNTHQISKICMGQDTFFKQMGRPYEASLAVYLLKDNSGSMEQDNKHEESCRALSVIEYALRGFPVKIGAFYSDGHKTIHIRIKDWKETSNTISFSETFLNNYSADGGNQDGADILIAAAELAARPEKEKLLIILSDGTPSAYNSERDAYGSVAYAVKKARKDGIKVISIFFGGESFLSSSQGAYAAMYERDIIGVTPDKISAELQKILKRQL